VAEPLLTKVFCFTVRSAKSSKGFGMIKALLVALFFIAGMIPLAVELQDEEEILRSESFLTSTCEERAKTFTQSSSVFKVLDTSLLTDTISRSEEAEALESASKYIFEDGIPETLTRHVATVEVAERAGRIRYHCSFAVDGDRWLFFYRMTGAREHNGSIDINNFQIYRLCARLVNTSSVEFSDKLEYLVGKFL